MTDNITETKREMECSRKMKEIVSMGVMMGMLLIVPFLALFIASDLSGQHLSYLLSMVSLYLLPLCFLRRKTYFKAMFIVLPLNMIEMVHLVMYKHTTTMMWVYTNLISEGGELLEGLSVYWPVVTIILLLYVLYARLNHKYVRKGYIAPKKIRYIAGGAMAAWILLCAALSFAGVGFAGGLAKVTPLNSCLQLGRIVHYQGHINEGLHMANSYEFGATTTAQEDELVILVLGESSRFGNWQINGYERATSPRLAARQDQIITYDSVFSVANLTTVSVPMILSRATPRTLSTYVEEASVVDAIHEAGYQTAWIADQSFGNKFMLNISGRCDYIYYIEHENFKFHDKELLQPLEQWIKKGGRQMGVFHALGCHFKYNARYTPEYSVFRPDLNDVNWEEIRGLFDANRNTVDEGDRFSAAANVVKTILTNSYDNAILYTDMIVDSVIAMAEATGRPAAVVYIGDHGENLLDDEHHKTMHGQVSNSIYEFHVPMFIWTSEQWRALHPKQLKAMEGNRHKHVSSMNVYHTLLDVADVTMPDYNAKMSVASEELVTDSAIWILDSNLQPTILQPSHAANDAK